MKPTHLHGRVRLSGKTLLVLVTLLALLGAVLALATRPQPSAAAQGAGQIPGYMRFVGPTLQGESADSQHLGWSDIVSFDQMTSKSGPTITVTKFVDAASPKLEEAALRGTVFRTGELQLTKPTANGATVFYDIKILPVRIASYRETGNADGQPLEVFTLKFREIDLTYTRIDADGTVKGIVSFHWKNPHPS